LLKRATSQPSPTLPKQLVPSSIPPSLSPLPRSASAQHPLQRVKLKEDVEQFPLAKINPLTKLKKLSTAQSKSSSIHHIYNDISGKKETIKTLLNGATKHFWNRSLSNKYGRSAQGNDYSTC